MGNGSILMLGPAQAGKTTLLGALSVAEPLSEVKRGQRGFPFRYTLDPGEMMRKLGEDAMAAVEMGSLGLKIGATDDVNVYEFDLEVDLRDTVEKYVLPNLVQKGHFEVYDGPGGAIFDDASAFRPKMIEKAKNASAMILCIDPQDTRKQASFLRFFWSFLKVVGRPLPFERVAIVLTKADQVGVEEYDCRSFVERTSPSEYAVPKLTIGGLGTLLKQTKADCTILCGWSSAYGFLQTGEPNFERKDPNDIGRFAHYQKGKAPDHILDDWEPFQVADPFVFALTGRHCSLEPLQWK